MSGTAAAKQLNIELPTATEYSLCPVQFFGKRKKGEYNPFTKPNGNPLSRAKIKILSLIWTTWKNFDSIEIPKTRFENKCGISYSVVLDSLKELELVDKLISSPCKDVYKIIPAVNGKDYFLLDNYLHKKKFVIDGKLKKLPATAVLILERIKAFYLYKDENGEYINYDFKNRKPKNYFESSQQGLATLLHLPKSTVSYDMSLLIKAKVLNRNKQLRYKNENGNVIKKIVQIKGIPGNTSSIYTIPYELLAVEQRSTYEPQEVDFIENLDEIEVTEEAIERVYAELREEAEVKTVTARKTAFADEEFIAANAECEEMQKAAFEEQQNGENVQKVLARWDKAINRRLKRLAELGISEEELLSPPYLCRRCKDTGQTDTGQRCRCRARIKELIVSRIFKRK